MTEYRPPSGGSGGSSTPADGSVTTAKLADGAVTAPKVNDALKPSAGAAAGTESLRALGSTAATAAAGNDSRLSDARTPTSHATSHQPGGTDAMAVDAAAGTGSLRTLSTTATSACAGNDSRLSDTRTPTDASVTAAKVADALKPSVSAAAGTESLRALGTSASTAAAGNDSRITGAAQLASSPTFTGEATAPDFAASGLTGATQASRYVGATTTGAPASGTFVIGDYVIARNGHLWICTTAGTPGTWTDAGSVGNLVTSVFTRTGAVVATSGDYTAAQVTNAADKSSGSAQNFTGNLQAPVHIATGLTGATQATRYVGATTSGAPASGTFAVGDFIVAQNGHIFVCTVAGTPGTWVDAGSVGNVVTSVFTRTGAVVATSGDYTAAQVTNAADKSSGSQQAFTGELSTPDLVITGLTGATAASRRVGATTGGAPASGTFAVGDVITDQKGTLYVCVTAGTPGKWRVLPVSPYQHMGNILAQADPRNAGNGAQVFTNARVYGQRVIVPRTCTISDIALFMSVSSGNYDVGIYDATVTPRTPLYRKGSTACSTLTANTWSVAGTPNLSVTAGQAIDLVCEFDNATAQFLRVPLLASGQATMPAANWTTGTDGSSAGVDGFLAWQVDTTFPLGTSHTPGAAGNYPFMIARMS